MKIGSGRTKAYRIASILILIVLALLFLFPLYWIVTGSFKSAQDIYAAEPKLFPTEWVTTNFEKLFAKRSAPLWELHVPFAQDANGDPLVFSTGPIVPGAIRWLVNTVFMSVMAMILTCITAAMAGYALAKKRFVGRTLLFSLIVCAMAPGPSRSSSFLLIKEMAALNLVNSLWAVIFPTVGWPFGVFLMKQFCEGIPGEILEAARVDGQPMRRDLHHDRPAHGQAGHRAHWRSSPSSTPGTTTLCSWSMLSSNSNFTISLGIADPAGGDH